MPIHEVRDVRATWHEGHHMYVIASHTWTQLPIRVRQRIWQEAQHIAALSGGRWFQFYLR